MFEFNKMRLLWLLILIPIIALFFIVKTEKPKKIEPVWPVRAIDTVKYSRDVAGQMLEKPDFDEVIDKQVSDVAATGASHIAISTPYDEQFKPFLERWVKSARNHGLKVWFRGNFSGWEQWFGYSRIDRATHHKMTEEFILNNPGLFDNEDIFTPCPECENGGPGDPRLNGDVSGHRQFLIEEYNISLEAFRKIQKKVSVGYFSMNYDVAKLIMDQNTTKALGNLVVIDHYVKDPKMVASDAKDIAQKTGGKVILGEFGAPIPDIHGEMTEEEQASWIKDALDEAVKTPEIVGVNYWVSVGGSTELWKDGKKRQAVDTLTSFFKLTKQVR